MKPPNFSSWLRAAGLPRRFTVAACIGLLATAAAPALSAHAADTSTPVTQAFNQVFSDDFSGTSVNKSVWSLYNNPTTTDAHAAGNVVEHDGILTLKTAYDSTLGKWTTAGVCLCGTSAPAHQTYGSYEMRARVSAGDSRAVALLWPDQGWPPEIDYMEMGGTGTQGTRQLNTQSLHYGADNKIIHTTQSNDFTQWHNVGVQWGPGYVRYTVDGVATNTIVTANVPTQPMHLGLQTNSMQSAAPTVPVNFDIDWVHQSAYIGRAGTAPAAPSNVTATAGDTSAVVSWTAPADIGNSLLSSYTITAEPGGKTMTVARSSTGNSDPATSATFTGLTPGVAYTFTVTANNPFGSSAASATGAAATVFGTAPSVTTAPSAAFVNGSTIGADASAPVKLSWATAAGSTAICAQQLTRTVNGTATAVKIGQTAAAVTDTLPAAAQAGYTLTATGCNGLASAPTSGPTRSYQLGQQDTAAYAGTWSTVTGTGFSGDTATRTVSKSASLTFTTAAESVALVAERGPADGSAQVFVDGALTGTVGTYATAVAERRVVWTTKFATPGTHTVTLVNNASFGHPNLTIDALATLN